ncbi:secondary thiamine-phosphate synthase enzyme YjbQ [Desulfovermiculus halophilus]|uniref:secondary thiamine-phosphate synthase enzyme YjbQ n=1 Tax=Desulfovermiculus halophilus TaxID=339722 RepID=UPI000483ECB9|nr:secondary thiamine-phosphate synthase enzyme YjbQ [Desulfovermiculus halophilus]
MQEIYVRSGQREEFIDITGQVREAVKENGWENGVLTLYCTHTTAGITINEAADPSVVRDMLTFLRSAVPRDGDYRHMEGNSDAHIKSSLMGCAQQVIVDRGKLVLGTWQGIFFTEFDGPRSRKIKVQWQKAE